MKKISAIIFSLAILPAAISAETFFPRLSAVPVIDGRVSPGEYAGGFAGELKKMRRKVTADKTQVYFGCDDKNFYAAFICFDSNIKTLKKMFRTGEEHDNAIFLDDCVEVRFDPWNDPKLSAMRHIIVNANGISYDAVAGDKQINIDTKIHTAVNADNWCVEIAVPLNQLTGYNSCQSELWRLGLMRFNPRSRETWSLTGDLELSFAAPAHYLVFRSGNINNDLPLTVTGFRAGKFSVRGEKALKKPINVKLEQLRIDGKIVGRTPSATVTANAETVMTLDLHSQARLLRFSADGKTVLEWDAPKKLEVSSNVRMTRQPLYKELWSDQPTGLVREGSMSWQHYFDPNFLVTALEFAIPWNLPDAMKIVHQEKLCLIVSGTALSPEWTDVTGISPAGTKFTGVTRYYEHKNIDAPRSRDGYPLLIDPRAKKAWLEWAVKRNKPYEKSLQMIHFGDEVNEHLEEYFIAMLKYRGQYPELDKMCETIKNEHGGGKFGPVESSADPNPYRWIAMRSFLSKELIGMHRDLKKLLAQAMPDVKLVSDDAGSLQNKLYDYAEFAPDVCDILTIQLYPLRDPDVSDYSFLCKYLLDLTNLEELHPCFHIANYGETYTPMEVLERISQGFRAGATGFHWYLADTSGARSGRDLGHDIVGAPERWQTAMALQREVRKMNKLKFPTADCGVFTPVTTLRAYPGGINNRPQKAMMLHSLLELHTKAWFKYFNETSIRKNKVDLNKFKVIFAADAQYCPADTLQSLVDYVKNGGILVVTDPNAFSFTGTADALDRKLLPGLNGSKRKNFCKNIKSGSFVLPLGKNEQFALVPEANSQILARYNNGDAAIIKTPLGKGWVIVSGVNFAHIESVRSPEWQKYFRDFTVSLGIKPDQDIWRFRFPISLIAPDPQPVSGRCVAGNYLFFNNFNALGGANEKVSAQAYYQYSAAPDAPAEPAKNKLASGKLTDRRRAYKTGHIDGNKTTVDDRIAGWSKPDAFSIEFDLVKPADISKIEIFCQGAMRDITVYSAPDGKNYRQVSVHPALPEESKKMAVIRKTLTLPDKLPPTAKIKLEFAATADKSFIADPDRRLPGYYPLVRRIQKNSLQKANFQISEIEIWAK